MSTGDFLRKFLEVVAVPFSYYGYSLGITEDLAMPPTPNSNVKDSEMTRVEHVILVDKCCLAKNYEWSHGDIAIFRNPSDNKDKIVQRIVGLPGDWILTSRKRKVVKVPEGYFWTEGDNSKTSLDLGFVPLDMIYGRVSLILWPPRRMGTVRKVDTRIPQKRFLLSCNWVPSPYSFK